MMLSSSFSGVELEVGVDEVGRGCLAGPVVAAAVIFPRNYENALLKDSKLLSEKKRLDFEKQIIKDAISYHITEVDETTIDTINILQASLLAMRNAIDALAVKPQFILVDGNRFTPYKAIPYECIVKGDTKYLSIAAASILAKNYRDKLMRKLAIGFPYYGWENNVGYPTKAHRKGIVEYGVSPHHRKSFKLLAAGTNR